MCTTEFNGMQYGFEADRLTVNGLPLLYSEISNISHRGGDQPAFIFDYKGRRYVLPYNPAEFRSILPYFVHARNVSAAPEEYYEPEPEQAYVEPEPTQEYYEPEPAQEVYEPEPAYEPVQEVYEPADEDLQVTEEDFKPAIEEYDVAGEDLEIAEADLTLDPGLEPEKASKKKLSPAKIIIGAVILAAIVAAAIFFVVGRSDDADVEDMSDADFSTEQDADVDTEDVEDVESPAPTGGDYEATDGFTVTDPDGSMDIKLTKTYTGDDALKKLTDLGEDKDSFSEATEAGYRLVLHEYEVQVKDGSMIGDTITGEFYMADKKTEFDDWWPCDLLNNVDKDLSSGEIDIPAGQTATVYIAYAMPQDIKEYNEKVLINEDGTEIWVHYNLDSFISAHRIK